MLVIWKEWGLDNILKKAYNNGILLCGISAGSICWFEEGLTDSIPNQLNKLDCLGILEGSNCPHFDGEKERQDIYKNKIRSGKMKKGIACDDGVGLHFINNKLEKVISSKADSFAYSFMSNNKEIIEKKLNPIRL
jgi:dipeptidase E